MLCFGTVFGAPFFVKGNSMLRLASLIFLLSITHYVYAESVPTHCNAEERAYLNCLIKGTNKVASVCGAHRVQYRFGRIGQPEFIFPPSENDADDQKNFRFSASRSAAYDRYDFALQFYDHNFSYVAYSGERRKTGGSTSYSSSITVWKMEEPCQGACLAVAPYGTPKGKIVKTLTCSNSDAGAELIGLNNKIPAVKAVNLPTPCLTCR